MTFLRLTKYVSILIFGTMVFAVLAVAISEVHSFDVFWQLQSGKYIWQSKSMIHSDLFTLAKDVPRSEHTWLHSLILFGLYSLGGYATISVLKGTLITATLICLALVARRRSASWTAILLVLPVFMMTSGGWLERPQLWTFLFFALFLLVLQRFLEQQSWSVLWLFPLAIFWANVHAGSVLAAALLVAFLVGGVGDQFLPGTRAPFQLRKLLVASGLVALASVISPYPGYLMNTLLNVSKLGGSTDSSGNYTVSMAQKFNMDWTLTTFSNEPLFFYIMAGSVLIILLGWRRISLVDLCLLAGLAMMGMKLVRHIPFFYMGAIAILPAYLDQLAEPVRVRLPELYRKIAALVLCCVAVALFWTLWQPIYKVYGTFKTGLREWHYPIAATEFVQEHKLTKNIYNTYDWGGYMAFKLYPEYLMFWDGRQNSAEMFQNGWNVMAGKPNWKEILQRFDVNTIVTRASTIDTGQKYPLLDRLRASDDWHLVFNSESSMIFVRSGSVHPRWLKRHERPKEQIDNTVLSEANLMIRYNAGRYMAWWEMAQIYMKRKQYARAKFALEQHMARSPKRNPNAERMYNQLLRRPGLGSGKN